MRTEIVVVTPEMAHQWLKKNKANRPLSQRDVERYAEQMKSGDWELTGDAVRFAKSGLLVDGQHRLTACCLAKTPFKTLVVRGLGESTFNKLDQGRKRSVGDAFARDGKRNYYALAAASRVVHILSAMSSSVQNNRVMSIEDGFQVLQSYPRLEINVAKCEAMRRSDCPMTISEVAGFWTYTECLHGTRVEVFWTGVLLGENLAKGDASLLLRRTLTESIIGGRALSKRARQAFIIKAFNGFITGKVPRLLKIAADEAVPGIVKCES